MDRVTQVCHHRFTHFLLLRDGCYLEFARLLLSKCEWRLLGLLSMGLPIHTIPIPCQQHLTLKLEKESRLTRLSMEESPLIGTGRLPQHRGVLFCQMEQSQPTLQHLPILSALEGPVASVHNAMHP